ncbi:MAG: penicillin acylase family protein [Chitinophagaceae bacterium]|nr:penicillin acylase family protein [Chitinophagaceae bacterium]MCW5928772.1 penicillin acylase family protein [Chitinophagaceae bacterium]
MKIVYFCISLLITLALIIILGSRCLLPLPLASFLSPQEGVWYHAEPVDKKLDETLSLPGLKGNTNVYFDERLVPHIVADNDEDGYFVQGYLHARFRLWQMEFQVYAAGGRVSEIVGDVAVNFDKGKRRLGMVYAAEKLLKEAEANPDTKTMMDAYTAGVNAYISSLRNVELPLEYRLLNYAPEPWTNFKTALFVKEMTRTLAGGADDLELTKARDFFGDEVVQLLFPQIEDSLSPVIPKGTIFPPPTVVPQPPASADALYFKTTLAAGALQEIQKPNKDNGSNNWAVSGSKTASGAPILCNDPHLNLTLPAIWFEIQMTTPGMNAYGVSFPGTPGVIIGFNDSIAFGFTNSSRDVMDYYAIRFKDDSKKQYFFDSTWRDTDIRIEEIKISGGSSVFDTVAYTVFGPVIYDASFPATENGKEPLALRWKAHDPSNELLFWYHLDRANNYDDYVNALQYFTAPAQNVVFASKAGDIAIWQQGELPARWKGQGLYIMPGEDSSYMWQGVIPMEENPHIRNPEQGFVSSANQRPADSTYPYFIPGSYDLYRGIAINRQLSEMNNITVEDMLQLMNDNYNVFAETARPVLLKHIDETALQGREVVYLEMVKNWSLKNDISEKGATLFNIWFDKFKKQTWKDEMDKAGAKAYPADGIFTEMLLRNDTSFAFADNINTPETETLQDIVTAAFKETALLADSLEAEKKLEWGNNKNTSVYHLLGDRALPLARTGLPVGGGKHIINATTHSHGPSWKMIVHLKEETEAWVVYPGGQSGNPGSPHYDRFVDKWAAGEQYRAWFLEKGESAGVKAAWKMSFQKNESIR